MRLDITQKTQITNTHIEALKLLFYPFGLSGRGSFPSPLLIIINDEERIRGLMACLSQDEKGHYYIYINKRKHDSFIDAETSCVHETGHYLQILKNMRNRYCFSYAQEELIAIASCFLYFEKRGRFAEFIQYLEMRYNPVVNGTCGLREKACLEIVKRGMSPYEMLQSSLRANSPIMREFEEVYNLIDKQCAEIIRGTK